MLVVEADLHAATLVAGILTSRGYDVRTALDVESAMSSVRGWHPDLLIADLEVARVEGVDLCQRVRDASNVPIIAVSSSRDPRSEVAALDAGADDYLVKPLVADQLMARVRVVLRRSGTRSDVAELGVGEFHIDFHGRRICINGQRVRLTPKEFDLFVFMARNPNRVLPHRTLLGAVWGEGAVDQSEYLRVFVGQLRKKLECDPSKPRYLVTEPWVGYRFNPDGLVQ
jgi:two-component system KDP operon response regulator KdpE